MNKPTCNAPGKVRVLPKCNVCGCRVFLDRRVYANTLCGAFLVLNALKL